MSTRHIILLFVLLLAALAPYCFAACYIVPLADDYSNGWEALRHPDLLSAVSHMYFKWSGRYTTHFFTMINPFIRWGTTGYELASLLMIATGIGVNYIVIRRIITGEAGRWIAALTVQLLFLFQLPDLSEGIFWYNGYMIYYLPGLGFAVCILLVTDILAEGVWGIVSYVKTVLALILIVIIAGFNEPMAVISLLFFAALAFFAFSRYPRARLFTALCVIAALGGVLLVSQAPGNSIRASQFHFDRSIVKVVLMTHLQILRFVADWVSNLPFLFLSVVVVIWAEKTNARWTDSIKLWWVGAALYIVLLLCIALPYWFTGVLGQQRTINMSYFFFIPLVFIALVKISRARFVFRVLSFMSNSRVMVIMVAVSIIFMALTKNGYKLGYDLAYGTLPRYKAEQKAREDQLRLNLQNDSFHLQPIQNRPLSITIYDEHNPNFLWVEKAERIYLLKVQEQTAH